MRVDMKARAALWKEIAWRPALALAAIPWALMGAYNLLKSEFMPAEFQAKWQLRNLSPWPWWAWTLISSGIIVSVVLESAYRVMRKRDATISEIKGLLQEQVKAERDASASYLRQSTKMIALQERVRVAEGELEPQKRELEDAYSLIENLKSFKDEAESLRKRIEDKDRELAALTPLEKQAGLRLQAQGVAQTIYDHNLKGWKRDFEGQAKHGLTIVIQIANLAVRGVSAKTVRVRAQAIYIKGDEQYVLAPLVWLDSSTSDVIIEPGEIREIIIARKLMFDFWDFTTHGGHGNVTPEQGIDFDLDVQLVDVDSGTILDVKPTTYFHWRWREGPLTPFFQRISPPDTEKELKADAGESK